MRAFRTGGREAVVALLAATALLAPAAAVGGYVAGQDIGQSRRPAPLASASSTPSVPPSVSPSSAMPSVSPTPSQRAGALSDEARALAARATVRLSPLSGSYSGSGSIVSADGLVLTNAHVAQRTAPGLATLYGTETYNEEDPEQLVVSTTEGDGPAAAAYLADVLAVDGYLDLAVLRIVATVDGRALPAGARFPAIPVGSVDAVQKGDDLTVYGFPGLTGGDLLAVTPGAVRTFVPDRRGRVSGDRFDIETTADFSSGNSGGMALDNDGRLVGVPRARAVKEKGTVIGRFARPVDLAQPLLEAARRGVRYASPYLTPATGDERGEDLGWTEENSCSAPGSAELDERSEYGVGRVRLSGLTPDEDVLLVLRRGEEVVRAKATVFERTENCLGIAIPSAGEGSLARGEYSLQVLVGPDRRPVVASSVTVAATGD